MEMTFQLSSLIVDSTLSVGGVQQNFRGFQQSIPNGLLSSKTLGAIAASLGILVSETSIALGRFPRPEIAIRACIFDDTLIQVDGPEVISKGDPTNGSPRSGRKQGICYLASKVDQNTPFEDVVSHAKEARGRRWYVDLHLWGDTLHCNHISKHEEEYAKAIKSMWMPETYEIARVRAKP